MQNPEMFTVSPQGLVSRGEDGCLHTLSNCEMLSILQMEDAVQADLARSTHKTTTYTVKITAIRRRSVTPVSQACVA